MKVISLFLLLSSGLLLSQCAKTPEATPKVDYDQQSIKIMQEVSPAIIGDWTLRRLYVKAQPHNGGQGKLGIKRDTAFQDFATLSIRSAASRSSLPDLRYPAFEGTLRFRTKTYPVQFELMASPERVVENKGPQAFFLLNYNYPVGSHLTEPEESFLQYLGFMQENFSLEVVPGQPNMTWHGLNRGIDKIELEKQ